VATACAGGHGRTGRFWAAVTAGWAEGLRNADVVDGGRLALMFEAAAEGLTGSDDGAHPGGPAAVAAAAADAALAASDEGAGLAEVLLAAADGGLAELERGPVADPDLARRGVVDATAAAFLLVVDVFTREMWAAPIANKTAAEVYGSSGPPCQLLPGD
jgi:dihydroxyacetone kinase-like predicted kinase